MAAEPARHRDPELLVRDPADPAVRGEAAVVLGRRLSGLERRRRRRPAGRRCARCCCRRSRWRWCRRRSWRASTRSAVLEVLREDFVRTARAKGLTPRAVLWRPRAAQRDDPGADGDGPAVRQPDHRHGRRRAGVRRCPASAGWCSRRSPTATCVVVRDVVHAAGGDGGRHQLRRRRAVRRDRPAPEARATRMSAVAAPSPAAAGAARRAHCATRASRSARCWSRCCRRPAAAVAGLDAAIRRPSIDIPNKLQPPSRGALARHRQPRPRHRLAADRRRAELDRGRRDRGRHRHRRSASRSACSPSARRGWVEELVMRLSDFTFAFPALLSAIMLTAIYGPGLVTVDRRDRHLQHAGVRAHHARRGQRGLVARVRARGARLRQGRAGASRSSTCCRTSPALLIVQATIQFAHRDPRRGGAQLPRPRHAAADAELGPHAQRGADADVPGAACWRSTRAWRSCWRCSAST